jgi:hypothetical protein
MASRNPHVTITNLLYVSDIWQYGLLPYSDLHLTLSKIYDLSESVFHLYYRFFPSLCNKIIDIFFVFLGLELNVLYGRNASINTPEHTLDGRQDEKPS